MSLLSILFAIVLVGVLLWAVTTYVPMAPAVRSLLVAVVVIVLVAWLLEVFGVVGALPHVRVTR